MVQMQAKIMTSFLYPQNEDAAMINKSLLIQLHSCNREFEITIIAMNMDMGIPRDVVYI